MATFATVQAIRVAVHVDTLPLPPLANLSMHRALALLLCCTSPALAQVVSTPEFLGSIAGPGAVHEPAGVRFYGTDLGWTFEHKGIHYMLFGDTWPHDRSMCDPLPLADDAQATIPLELPAGVPPLVVQTDPAAPNEFARLKVLRDGQAAVMGYNKTPMTAFSDGEDVVSLFGEIDLVRCGTKRGKPSCSPHKHLECSQDVGICTPQLLGYDAVCDLATNTGCILGQTCTATDTGLCIDPGSSQDDGTSESLPYMAAYHTHVGVQDPAQTSDYHDIGTFASNKFININARTVRCFSGRRCGDDYGPGHGAVLIWGRPGFGTLPGHQAHLYLMALPLPLERTRDGAVRWRPRYYAGVKKKTGEPIWSKHESRAVGLAMDGVVGGNPDDDQRTRTTRHSAGSGRRSIAGCCSTAAACRPRAAASSKPPTGRWSCASPKTRGGRGAPRRSRSIRAAPPPSARRSVRAATCSTRRASTSRPRCARAAIRIGRSTTSRDAPRSARRSTRASSTAPTSSTRGRVPTAPAASTSTGTSRPGTRIWWRCCGRTCNRRARRRRVLPDAGRSRAFVGANDLPIRADVVERAPLLSEAGVAAVACERGVEAFLGASACTAEASHRPLALALRRHGAGAIEDALHAQQRPSHATGQAVAALDEGEPAGRAAAHEVDVRQAADDATAGGIARLVHGAGIAVVADGRGAGAASAGRRIAGLLAVADVLVGAVGGLADA